jgi:hypothetical protein
MIACIEDSIGGKEKSMEGGLRASETWARDSIGVRADTEH